MEKLIEYLTWLDESNVAYLLMMLFSLAMVWLHSSALDEITRLRRALKNAVLENKK